MRKTANEVEKTIKKHFPKLKYIWLLDKEYELPTLAELEEMIKERLESPATKKLFELMASSDDFHDDRIKYFHGSRVVPFIPYSECTFNTGHLVIIELWRES